MILQEKLSKQMFYYHDKKNIVERDNEFIHDDDIDDV